MAIKLLSFGLWAVTALPMVLGGIGYCNKDIRICENNCNGFHTDCFSFNEKDPWCCKRMPGYGMAVFGIVFGVIIFVIIVLSIVVPLACIFCACCLYYRDPQPVILPVVYQAPVVDGQMPPPKPPPSGPPPLTGPPLPGPSPITQPSSGLSSRSSHRAPQPV